MAYKHHFLFGKKNFIFVLVGVGLILLGFLLMVGGDTTDPMIYPEAELYGFQRTVLAPAIILAGFVVEGIAIFVGNGSNSDSEKL